MNNKKTLSILGIIAVAVLVVTFIFLVFTPAGHSVVNKWNASLQQADIDTSYANQKEIEDTLRSYIASYEADKITWETNCMLESIESQQLATAALTRANRTAATYNQYYLKNSYVWKNNIPADIKTELPYLSEAAD